MIHADTDIQVVATKNRRHVAIQYMVFLVVLAWPAIAGAQILDPGFEGDTMPLIPFPESRPVAWRLANTNGSVLGSQVTTLWWTEGEYSAGLFSRVGQYYSGGEYQGIWQYVNLTEIDILVFDVALAAYEWGALVPFGGFEASLWVGGIRLWTEARGGIYLDEGVNVSGFTGIQRVELRITAIAEGQSNAEHWVLWDNLQTAAAPVETIVEACIDVNPGTLNLNSNGKWITCYITLPAGYDVMDIDGDTITLGGVSAHMGTEAWATPEANAHNIVDRDGDGVLERMVKFDRAAVQALLSPGDVTVTVVGMLDGDIILHGTDVIRVIGKGKGK